MCNETNKLLFRHMYINLTKTINHNLYDSIFCCTRSVSNYNTIIPPPLSAARDNSRQLAGGNARARSSGGIIGYNIFRFRDWKGCNVIRAHDTI